MEKMKSRKEYYREYDSKNREKRNKYYLENKESVLKRNRKNVLMRKFGITPDDYKNMNTKQKGLCKICGRKNESGKILAVDHCHITGKVRGLLCSNCNRGIGLLRDDVKLLEKAIKYLHEEN